MQTSYQLLSAINLNSSRSFIAPNLEFHFVTKQKSDKSRSKYWPVFKGWKQVLVVNLFFPSHDLKTRLLQFQYWAQHPCVWIIWAILVKLLSICSKHRQLCVAFECFHYSNTGLLLFHEIHANLAILATAWVFCCTWAILRAQSCASNKLRLV